MSGLFESIVRRRRASASSRLGPPPESDLPSAEPTPHVNGTAATNGGPPALAHVALNGSAPAKVEADFGEEPVAAEAEEIPVATEAEEIPVATEAEEIPVATEAEEIPVATEAEEISVAAEAEEDPVAAEAEEEPEPEPARFLQRGRIRRRARYLRQLREVQLRDLGGFIVELSRFGRDRPDLVRDKVERTLQTDAELRALERALGSEQPLRELREAGIGGVCPECGTVHGTADRFCSACGEPLDAGAETDDAGRR